MSHAPIQSWCFPASLNLDTIVRTCGATEPSLRRIIAMSLTTCWEQQMVIAASLTSINTQRRWISKSVLEGRITFFLNFVGERLTVTLQWRDVRHSSLPGGHGHAHTDLRGHWAQLHQHPGTADTVLCSLWANIGVKSDDVIN